MVSYQRGYDKITVAAVDIPAAASTAAARAQEEEYLQRQGPEMERRYRETLAKLSEANAAEQRA